MGAQVPNPVWLFVIPWAVACQDPLSMGIPRQEYWSGFPFPSPGDLPDPGIKPASLALAGGFSITEPPGKTVVQFACLKEGGNEGMGGGRTLLSSHFNC